MRLQDEFSSSGTAEWTRSEKTDQGKMTPRKVKTVDVLLNLEKGTLHFFANRVEEEWMVFFLPRFFFVYSTRTKPDAFL